jgi:glycosyltransferase involved in cell wall biosynthesis
MRIGVYNRYWATGGGAEKYGGVIAQVLAGDGRLELLTHDPVDLDWLGERLHLDLAKVTVREIEDEPGGVTAASAEYDLFVNVSYMSHERAAHPRSLYVVHFPSPLDNRLGGRIGGVGRQLYRLLPGPVPARLEWGEGFHAVDPGARPVAWTSGEGTLRVVTRPGRPVTLQIVLAYRHPPDLGPIPVTVEVGGETAARAVLAASPSPVRQRMGTLVQATVCSPEQGVPVDVRILSDSFRPSDVLGGDDHRRLGVPVQALRVAPAPLAVLGRWQPFSMAPPASATWVSSYGAVVSNSEFTRGWVQRRWKTDSEVLFPPISMHEPGEKEPVILNVGRFFAAEQGHSKKQKELVRAFRQLCDQGVTGWTLHLVGGCAAAGEAYADEVRQLAEGYPVELHINASGDELQRLYRAASIYWHASGWGEDAEKHPDRLEHFGITTVEAMSAGAVPVVIGLAGQLETVRAGVDGYHFSSQDELVTRTAELIDNPERRAEMSRSARQRAREFSTDAFERRLRAVVDGLPTDG